jgi:PIN domain nuclease of toxin-antitoxin system
MNYLLDTHILVWYANDDDFLPDNVKAEITKSDNSCYTSIASLLEITIKAALGKLLLRQSISEFANLHF